MVLWNDRRFRVSNLVPLLVLRDGLSPPPPVPPVPPPPSPSPISHPEGFVEAAFGFGGGGVRPPHDQFTGGAVAVVLRHHGPRVWLGPGEVLSPVGRGDDCPPKGGSSDGPRDTDLSDRL